MKKFFAFLRNKHDVIFKIMMFLVTVGLIVVVFPQEGTFRYEYTKGKPWLHPDLFASFDFAIQKTEAEIQEEREEIIRNSPVYFREDTALAGRRLMSLDIDFQRHWNLRHESPEADPAELAPYSKNATYKVGRNLLSELFNKGIIEVTDYIERKDSNDFVTIISNNVAEEKPLMDLFTIQSAFNYINIQLEKHRNVDPVVLMGLFENLVTHNIIYDPQTTQTVLEQQLEDISLTRGKVDLGARIISRGDIVDQEKFRVLESYRSEYQAQVGNTINYLFLVSGQVILVTLALLVIFFFIYLFRKDIVADNLKVSFLLLITLLMVLMASLSLRFDAIHIYMLPFGILPIVVRAFYDTRLALFTHLVTIMIIGFLAPNGFEFAFIQLIAGIFAVFSIANLSKRSQLFFTAFIIFASYSLCYLGFALIEEGNVNSIEPFYFGFFGISAMMTLFSYPLIYLFEKMFGFISDVTLIELSDTNSPLLRELAMRAPGTFQHSLQVANLAEEATFEIGGDALLVRTGALYHDIGKMDMPRYFIENQTSGINPHDELNFEESAGIIIGHVIRGIEKAKKFNLPENIIDFIRTHHGDTMVQYFYKSYLKQFPDKLVDEKMFRYPGPRPFSKETAVLMMADSVEAASRALKSYDAESIDKLVESIIDYQISEKQFVNADITFKDITTIKKILKKKLSMIYHVRIEYPK
ncbi:MAG: HDIG domain-containing protein [Bacteroidetes bacterium]|nr:HDIG domain-containing protein [Bacteroidota bacterium]